MFNNNNNVSFDNVPEKNFNELNKINTLKMVKNSLKKLI